MEQNTSNIRTTPKDFFLQLGSIAALYISVISLLTLIFEVINMAFPDALNRGYYADPYSSGMRMAIASLIVVFPIYLVLSWFLQKEYSKTPTKRELPIRRWLSHLTLFVAGAVIAGSLIALINTFLGGEITSRFVLKALSVIVVAGMAFGYYLYDLRVLMSRLHRNIFAYASVEIVIASLVFGFIYLGSPVTQREMRLDRDRVMDLQQIQSTVLYQYWQMKGKLPENKEELNTIIDLYLPVDPETKEEYEYNKISDLSFELCAIFARKSDEKNPYGYPEYPRPMMDSKLGLESQDWDHEAGRHCFQRTIDPEIYPPMKDRKDI